MGKLSNQQLKTSRIVIAYPFVLVVIAVLVNLLLLDIGEFRPGLPSEGIVYALVILAVILVINHTWLMTATELTRVRYELKTTPEEWEASGKNWKDVTDSARLELDRAHNAHRNTTENVVIFAILLIAFVLSNPPATTVYAWTIGFGLSRLGYTYSYLSGRDNFRSAFMTLGLISMYGIATYIVVSMMS